MILVFRMLSFKLAFSLSSFTFIKRLFSSSSLCAVRVLSSEVIDISPGNLDSSLWNRGETVLQKVRESWLGWGILAFNLPGCSLMWEQATHPTSPAQVSSFVKWVVGHQDTLVSWAELWGKGKNCPHNHSPQLKLRIWWIPVINCTEKQLIFWE